MFKWIEGRQGGGYAKLPIIVSERFKFDIYILRYPPNFALSKHNDPCPDGYEHHRINIRLLGQATYHEHSSINMWGKRVGKPSNKKMLLDADRYPIGYKFVSGEINDRPTMCDYTQRILRIRPDVITHSVTNGPKWTYTLSIGWLKRKNNV